MTLKNATTKEWAEIPPSVTESFVLSMPARLQAVIDSNGGPTKY